MISGGPWAACAPAKCLIRPTTRPPTVGTASVAITSRSLSFTTRATNSCATSAESTPTISGNETVRADLVQRLSGMPQAPANDLIGNRARSGGRTGHGRIRCVGFASTEAVYPYQGTSEQPCVRAGSVGTVQRQEIVDGAFHVHAQSFDVARSMDVVKRSHQVQPHEHAEKFLGAASRVLAAQQSGCICLVQPLGKPVAGCKRAVPEYRFATGLGHAGGRAKRMDETDVVAAQQETRQPTAEIDQGMP